MPALHAETRSGSPVAPGALGPVRRVLLRLLVLQGVDLLLRQVPAAVLEHEGPRGDGLAGDDAVAEPRPRVQARPQAVLRPGLPCVMSAFKWNNKRACVYTKASARHGPVVCR